MLLSRATIFVVALAVEEFFVGAGKSIAGPSHLPFRVGSASDQVRGIASADGWRPWPAAWYRSPGRGVQCPHRGLLGQIGQRSSLCFWADITHGDYVRLAHQDEHLDGLAGSSRLIVLARGEFLSSVGPEWLQARRPVRSPRPTWLGFVTSWSSFVWNQSLRRIQAS